MSKTLAAYRAARSVELMLEGWSFDEIAAELGYRDRSGPWRAAQRCLARRQQVAADNYIAAYIVDLEVVEERAFPRAAAGDLEAGRVVLRAIEDRMRLAELVSTRGSTAPPSVPSARPESSNSSGLDSPTKASSRPPETGFFTSLVV